jgi:hypothetical protein
LFAACPLDDRIEVLDAGIKNIFRLRYDDFCVGLAVRGDGATLYATNYFSNTVSVIDISALDAAMSRGEVSGDAPVVHTVRVAQGPYGIALSPDGKRLYAAQLQWFGAVYVGHVVKSASATNSVFALVLGLLAFLYLIATTLLLCGQVNVVATDHLYPRALLTPFTDDVELTRGDRDTYTGLAKAQRAKGFQHIDVTFDRKEPDDAQA